MRRWAGALRLGANGRLTSTGRQRRSTSSRRGSPSCLKMDVRFSITIRQHKSLRNLIEAIPEEAWTPIPYWMDGAADVAESHLSPLPELSPDAPPVAAHRPACEAHARFPAGPLRHLQLSRLHHRPGRGDGSELEADHRRHAEVENAIRDLKSRCGVEPGRWSGALRRQRRLAGGTGVVGVATYIRLREEVHAQVSNFYYTADHGDAVHDPQLFVVSRLFEAQSSLNLAVRRQSRPRVSVRCHFCYRECEGCSEYL